MLQRLIGRVTRLSPKQAFVAATALLMTLGVLTAVAASANPAPNSPNISSGPANPSPDGSAKFVFASSTSGVAYKCALDSAAFAGCTSPVSYAALALGNHMFNVRATQGDKTSGTTSFGWTVQVARPNLTANVMPATQSTSVTFIFTNGQAGITYLCSVDGSAASTCASPLTLNNLTERAHTFSVVARSALATSTPASFTWSVDRTPPPAPKISSAPVNTTSTAASVAFTDSESGVTYRCSLDGTTPSACTSPSAYSGLAVGMHSVAVAAVDAAGNVSPTTSAAWTVQQPPQPVSGSNITLAGSVTRQLAPGLSAPLDVSITNPNNFDVVVSNLQITVNPRTTKAGQSNPQCDGPTNLKITQFSGAAFKVKESRTLTLSALGIAQSQWPVVTMPDLPTNQDACKSTTFTYTYAATVTRGQS
ncbi:MAG: hypothetical protein ACTHMS_20245 [Jatrophihabitans sp.]|uniref:hypothetical protein n=1 Tax=Jatrophihabitans sp. TaxID=1932789 RepID=UPI003F7F9CEF